MLPESPFNNFEKELAALLDSPPWRDVDLRKEGISVHKAPSHSTDDGTYVRPYLLQIDGVEIEFYVSQDPDVLRVQIPVHPGLNSFTFEHLALDSVPQALSPIQSTDSTIGEIPFRSWKPISPKTNA